MPIHLCQTCGTTYPESATPPPRCPICADDRQYVAPDGQAWTTLDAVLAEQRPRIEEEAPGITGLGSEPGVGISQRPLLVEGLDGNILWDCSAYVGPELIDHIRARGGMRAIAISHPHFFTAMADWSRALEVPILLHDSLRQWVQRGGDRVQYWSGDSLSVSADLTLLRIGGHYPGATALHWRGGDGVLCVGDTLQVAPGRDRISVMYSYPNMLPLSAAVVEQIRDRLAPWDYAAIFGGWWGRIIRADAKAITERSLARYLAALQAPAQTDEPTPGPNPAG